MTTQVQSKETTTEVVLPPFVTRYIQVRQQIDECNFAKKELEKEVIEWGRQQLETATKSRIPLGKLGKEAELSISTIKPKEADALANCLELRQLQEEIQEERDIALSQNEVVLADIRSKIETLQKQLEQFSNTFNGHALQKEYDLLLKKELRKCPVSYQLRYRDLS